MIRKKKKEKKGKNKIAQKQINDKYFFKLSQKRDLHLAFGMFIGSNS